MKTLISLAAIAVSLSALPTQVAAQVVPPACQQFIKALKVCGADLVKYTELTNPEQAPEVRAAIEKSVSDSATTLREQIKLNGELVVAQRCATSPGKEQMQAAIANIVTVLNFGGAISEGCSEAFGALR
jgi:hypothetical protein